MASTPIIPKSLQQVFRVNNMSLTAQSDHIVVENSSSRTDKEIKAIVASVGFSSVVEQDQVSKNFVFRVFASPEDMTSTALQETSHYFSFDELTQLLQPHAFRGRTVSGAVQDDWDCVNRMRKFVSPAFNKLVSNVVASHLKRQFYHESGDFWSIESFSFWLFSTVFYE
jgi:hypothetical protein